jgi:hypothetical protein
MFEGLKRYGKFNMIDLKKLRAMRAKGRYLRYYVRPAGNGRNTLAKNIDFYGLTAAAAVIACFILAGYTGSPARALLYTIFIMMPVVWLAARIKKAAERERVTHFMLWRAGRLCQQRIKDLGSGEKLQGLLLEILEKMPAFSDVHLLKGNEDCSPQAVSMDLRALRQGAPLLVGSIMPGPDEDKVPAEKVSVFMAEIARLNMKEGILVAAGTFSNEARRTAREGGKKVALVDIYRLVELSRMAGHSIFPAQSCPEPGDQAGRRQIQRRKLLRNAFSRDKARGYLLSSAMMIALYCTLAPPGLPGAVYLFFGAANLTLALYCFISNRETDLLGGL